MYWAIVFSLFILLLVGAGVGLLVQRLRGAAGLSPILLDDALDADLRRLRKRLRLSGLSLETRRRLATELVRIAARRSQVGRSERDQDDLRRLSEAVSGR